MIPDPTRQFQDFNGGSVEKGTIVETGNIEESSDANWWVNSGAYLYYTPQGAHTIQGELPGEDPWRLRFAQNNPSETDNGYHPQNIFRLVTRTTWRSYTQQVYFKVNRTILSGDSHREASNGLLLFNHYLDDDTLYYTGLRVDGCAVIKKKVDGTYYTLAVPAVLPGTYDRDHNPNLIPLNTWIGIRSVVRVRADRSVDIQVYTDIGKSGEWTLAAAAVDDGSQGGGPPIDQAGFAGIRTDFMDVEFLGYSIKELN